MNLIKHLQSKTSLKRIIYSIIYKMSFDLKNIYLIKLLYISLSKIFLVFPFVLKILNTKSSNKLYISIISEKYKFYYIENPLVATISTQNLFLTNPIINFHAKIKYLDHDKISKHISNYSKYIKFSIVRNPWSRVVSCYNKKIMNANNLAKISLLSQFKGLYPIMSFKNFIKWLCSENGKDEHADPHWISQYRILFDKNGNPFYNFLIKLEDLETDFSKLFKRLDLPSFEIPRIGGSKGLKHKPLYSNWKGYYKNLDYNLIKEIEKRYEIDAKLFNYPKLTSIIRSTKI